MLNTKSKISRLKYPKILYSYREDKEEGEEDAEAGEKKEEEDDDEDDDDEGGGMLGNIKTAVISLLVLSAVLAMGGYFFSSCQDLSFFDGFYFCFISLTTIGFGDIVPDLEGGELNIFKIKINNLKASEHYA